MTRDISDRIISIGTEPNDNTGDTLRTAFRKARDNFAELYANTDAGIVRPSQLTANLANYTNTATMEDRITARATALIGDTGVYQRVSTLGAAISAYLPTHAAVINATAINATSIGLTGDATISGNLTVTGNLTLTGATIFTNAVAITTNDKYFILANNATTNTLANSSGIIIGTSANLIYHSTAQAWQSNVNFVPAANNLGLGNTSSIWNLYSNNIYSITSNSASYNTGGGYGTATGGAIVNTTNIGVGNSIVNTFITSSGLNVNGAATVANNTGVWTSGTVNAAFHTTGGGYGTATGGAIVNTNTIAIGNSISNTVVTASGLNVNSVTVANNTGLWTTGTVNAYTVNATMHTAGPNVALSSISLQFLGNDSTSPSVTLANSGSFTVGNGITTQTTSKIDISNTTGNVVITPGATSIKATGSINALSISTGPNVGFTNASFLFTGNTSLSPTIILANTGSFVIGNGSTTQTLSTISISNSTGNVVITPGVVSINATGNINASSYAIGATTWTVDGTKMKYFPDGGIQLGSYDYGATNSIGGTKSNGSFIGVGNSTIYTTISPGALTATSNTLTLGTSTSAANGYTYLPNGFKMNWGWVSSSLTTGDITFTSSFTTNAYVVVATSNTATATYQAGVVSWTKAGCSVRTANTTATNVFWQAIGY